MDQDKKYSIEEVFSMIGEQNLLEKRAINKNKTNIIVDGYLVHPLSMRYMCFYQHGTTCVCCGRRGAYFKLIGSADGADNRRHFDLYADDGTLMTKDHIIPVSRGGKNNVDNMQTMCKICNQKKADSLPRTPGGRIIGFRPPNDAKIFNSIKDAAMWVVETTLKPSRKHKKDCISSGIKAVLGIQMSIECGEPFCGRVWKPEDAE